MDMKRTRRHTLLLFISIFLLTATTFCIFTLYDRYNIPTLNVKDAGAKGDGKHNDTAAFMSVLKQASKLKRTQQVRVIIPPGTYLIDVTEPMPLLSNIHLQGIGRPILKFTSFTAEQHGYEAFMISGHNVHIDGIVIDGAYRLIRGIGIHTGSSHVVIENTVIQRMRQGEDPQGAFYSSVVSGIMIYGRTTDITIRSSRITDVTAIHDPPVSRGIMVLYEEGEPFAKRVRINGNEISHIAPKEDADGIFFDTTPINSPQSDSIIENNVIHHTAKRGIKIAAPGVTVRNNHIINSYAGNNTYLSNIEQPLPQDMYSAISVYASHVTLSGNKIDSAGSFYSAIEVDAGAHQDITIENNIITLSPNHAIKSTAIRLGDVSSYYISDNTINNADIGIYLTEVNRIRQGQVSGNRFNDVEVEISYPTLE